MKLRPLLGVTMTALLLFDLGHGVASTSFAISITNKTTLLSEVPIA